MAARPLFSLVVGMLPIAVVTLGSEVACGGTVDLGGVADSGGADPFADEVDPPLVAASKIDVLFAVDNSSSMQDKQRLLAKSVGAFLRRLVEPRCVDALSGAPVGQSVGGSCSAGVLEHAPIRDIHVGVVSSSLGTVAGSHDDYVCAPSGKRMNDRAHLLTAGRDGSVANAAQGFLAYAPGGGPNTISETATLESDVMELVLGVGQTGCGFEAQLESMYRFLVQPDPPVEIRLDSQNRAVYSDEVDIELLKQRAAFLRPDSALAIVMLTDEDDATIDPRSVEGRGWAFGARRFPDSKVTRQVGALGTTAPRGTDICATDPASPSCTSCWFAHLCDPNEPSCITLRSDPACSRDPFPIQALGSGPGVTGYYGAYDDAINVRFHKMKERYGLDPQYPIERYVRALTNRKAPSLSAEHNPLSDDLATYDPKHASYIHAPTCTNPLFAAVLPGNVGDELCDLPAGGRSRRLISFTLIAGVPQELVPTARLSTAEWRVILGRDPDAFDDEGIDAHMIPSREPRSGLRGASLVRGDNGSDPIHGREWDTAGDDLQFACTFPLSPTIVCEDSSCACDAPEKNPPLCSATNPREQIRGKAYPSIRPLRVAKGLGARALVGSICAKDPATAYDATLSALATHLSQLLVK